MADIRKAAGILIKDRKLLVERSTGKQVFVSPGGRVEQGETDTQALVRELKEEFQIDVKESDLEKFGTFNATAAGNPDKNVSMQTFLVRRWEGEPTPDNEVEEIRWIDSETPQELLVGSVFVQEVIPRLKAMDLID